MRLYGRICRALHDTMTPFFMTNTTFLPIRQTIDMLKAYIFASAGKL
jgi:hypothetical protein